MRFGWQSKNSRGVSWTHKVQSRCSNAPHLKESADAPVSPLLRRLRRCDGRFVKCRLRRDGDDSSIPCGLELRLTPTSVSGGPVAAIASRACGVYCRFRRICLSTNPQAGTTTPCTSSLYWGLLRCFMPLWCQYIYSPLAVSAWCSLQPEPD